MQSPQAGAQAAIRSHADLVEVGVRMVRARQAVAVDLDQLEPRQLAVLDASPCLPQDLHHRRRLAGAGHPRDVQALAQRLVACATRASGLTGNDRLHVSQR